MRWRLLCVAVVMLAGCGKSKPIDPQSDRLPEQTEARVYSAEWPEISLMVRRPPNGVMVDLLVGTRTRVLDDSDQPKSSPPNKTRLVRVLVLDGKHEGEAGEIPRMFLRARVGQ